MKAIFCPKYGPPEVLEMKEIPKPVPKDYEVLIKNHAASVTVADTRIRGFRVPKSFRIPARLALGITRPRNAILGGEFSGVVESVGKKVSLFKEGDQVFGFKMYGCYAEYICIPESGALALKPDNLSFEEAAVLSLGGSTALHFLRKAHIQGGEKVLIYGASGSVGTYAVQLAKYFGAHVTGVCSTTNLELVKSIGADEVIDYTTTDLSTMRKTYDIIFETVGKCSVSTLLKMLTKKGKLLHAVSMPDLEIRIKIALINSKKSYFGGTFKANHEMINFLKQRAEEEKLKPIIDKTYPLTQITKAHHYVDLGHKKGNVAICIQTE